MEKLAGKIVTIIDASCSYCRFRINEDKGEWLWSKDMFEGFAKPTKKELFEMPLGTIIKTDGKEHNIFVKVGEDDFCNDDLSLKYSGNKIIEIQEPSYTTIYRAEEEVKEMTIAEIEKELGYPIKVIKEDIKD